MAKRQRQRQRGSSSLVGQMVGTGVANIVGVGMIGATASAVGGLPAGTAKDIAGVVPGLQSVALLGPNLKLVNTSLGNGKKKNSKNYW
jgi:hypothetical protein